MVTVKYELAEIGKYISEGEPHTRTAPDFSRSDLTAALNTIQAEVQRIKNAFTHELFSAGDEHYLERYFQNHQLALIRLMDNVAHRLKARITPDAATRNFLQFLYAQLDELLTYIERHFSQYFNLDAKAPEAYIAMASRDARISILKLHKGLLTRGVDIRLINVLFQAARRIIQGRLKRDITYRSIIYRKEVQQEVLRLIANENVHQDMNEELRQALYYLNFNSAKCVSFWTAYVDAQIRECETSMQKVTRLSQALKNINQALVKPGLAYHANTPSLKSQVTAYIVEEMKHLERIRPVGYRANVQEPDTMLPQFKVKFEISVAQLSCILKLFLETKLIQHENLTELLRVVARSVVTKRTEEVSYDSLRAKYYNVEQGARTTVRTLLSNMIRYMDTNQF